MIFFSSGQDRINFGSIGFYILLHFCYKSTLRAVLVFLLNRELDYLLLEVFLRLVIKNRWNQSDFPYSALIFLNYMLLLPWTITLFSSLLYVSVPTYVKCGILNVPPSPKFCHTSFQKNTFVDQIWEARRICQR